MAVQTGHACVVHPSAVIADDVIIGPFSVIEDSVTIGASTVIGNSVTIGRYTTLGRRNLVYSNVVLGSHPQDLTFAGEETKLVVGDDNTFREFVTANVGTRKGGGMTRIGSSNLLMACSHVAHDCHVGDNVVMGNCALLGGHVHVGNGSVLSGAAAFHHYASIGQYAFVGGLTRIVQDVPPFMIVEGNPSKVRGVNVVGLRRAGFPEERIEALKEAYSILYKNGLTKAEAIERIESWSDMTEEVGTLVVFLKRMLCAKHGRHRQP